MVLSGDQTADIEEYQPEKKWELITGTGDDEDRNVRHRQQNRPPEPQLLCGCHEGAACGGGECQRGTSLMAHLYWVYPIYVKIHHVGSN